MELNGLIREALRAREKAYSPYSGYRVGAALLAESGVVYTGCNVENASYGATMCAERTAVFKAVSEGERGFEAIVIVGGPDKEEAPLSSYTYPCGMCRQVLSEFGKASMRVIVARSESDYREFTLGELLPESFVLSGQENQGGLIQMAGIVAASEIPVAPKLPEDDRAGGGYVQ